MKLEWAFLRSQMARRIFLSFVPCALPPIAFLPIVSFGHRHRGHAPPPPPA